MSSIFVILLAFTFLKHSAGAKFIKELIHFLNTTGRKKVMFGTNFPQLSWKVCVEQAKTHLKLREGVAEDFFSGNISRVLQSSRIETRGLKL
jgi:predicted TIM-barrel fold metal-dependent hydrolase